ncbi:PREDICTED: tropinone reductase 1-like [Prunus mume]|uniref:Tropinone reductase 1-like n=1 Tax=Prunus mume TaxID=102107 RepID=A0ABM1LJG7_PRUMU|nr:PREDICTED: tropinone reductase 1-like [Prunus mume]
MASFNSLRWSLKGMNALVVGVGGNKGIGYTMAEELAGLGATVQYACSSDQAPFYERNQEWESKGVKVTGSVFDLKSTTQRENLMNTFSSAFDGKLNILVKKNLEFPSIMRTWAIKSSMRNTIVDYPYRLSLLAYPLLKASGNASVVFLASFADLKAEPELSAFAETSSAVTQNSQKLAWKWAKDNIRTNTPNEISSLVTFLCLPAASYINGKEFYIDGQQTVCDPVGMWNQGWPGNSTSIHLLWQMARAR